MEAIGESTLQGSRRWWWGDGSREEKSSDIDNIVTCNASSENTRNILVSFS